MRRLVVAAVLAGASPVQADSELAAEVAGGANTTNGEVAASASVHVAANLSRSVPIMQRGARICPSEAKGGCVWLYTGVEHAERDGLGIDGSAQLLADSPQLDGRAWAAFAGWHLEGRMSYQPNSDLAAVFTRSNRAVLQQAIGIGIAPMWSLGNAAHQLIIGRTDLDFGWRSQRAGDAWLAAGFDVGIDVRSARFQSRTGFVDLFVIDFQLLGLTETRDGDQRYGTNVTVLDFDLLSIDHAVRDDLAIVLRGGITSREPISRFLSTGQNSHSEGPLVPAVSYWAGARYGAPDSGVTTTIGAGSWMRLDPTGHAVDYGQLASLVADVRRARYAARGELQLGRLERVAVGMLAPPDLAGVGTQLAMGRASLGVSLKLTSQLMLAGTGWVEHSDRDDIRWTETAGVQTHIGANVNAIWALARRR